MSENAHPLTTALASCVAYGEHLGLIADFLEETTRDEAEDGRRWCKYLMPALNELHDISRVVESHMSVLAVVGGASVNDACKASQQTYYLTRRAFTTIPHTARLIESFSAPEIGTLRGRPVAEVFEGLEFFGGKPTFWGSYFEDSRARSEINEALKAAAAEWALFFRSSALAIATHAPLDMDVATWALRLLEDIGEARVQIKNSLDTTIRYASEIGMKSSEITRVSKVGPKGVRRRISKERVAGDRIIAAAAPKAPATSEALITVIARDAGEIIATRNGNELARGDTYAQVLGLIHRQRYKMAILEVRDGVIAFEHSAAVMQRYGLRSIRFEPVVTPQSIAA